MSGDTHEEDAAAAGTGRGGKIKVIAGALVLLLIGAGAGAGGAMMMGGSSEASASEGEAAAHGEEAAAHGEEAPAAHGEEPPAHGEEPPAHGEEPPAHGEPAEGGHGGAAAPEAGPPVHKGRTVVSLGLFTVNLRGSGGGRVLRTEVQVEVNANEYQIVDTRKPVLRDAVITLASDFSYSDLEGLDGKTHLRDELQGRLNSILTGSPKVERVYFTEFVVQ